MSHRRTHLQFICQFPVYVLWESKFTSAILNQLIFFTNLNNDYNIIKTKKILKWRKNSHTSFFNKFINAVIRNKKNPPFKSAVLCLYRTIESFWIDRKKTYKDWIPVWTGLQGFRMQSLCDDSHKMTFSFNFSSTLDILDDIFKFLFCVHVKGFAWLYCGKLEEETWTSINIWFKVSCKWINVNINVNQRLLHHMINTMQTGTLEHYLNVSGIEFLLHHLFQDSERGLDSIL